MPLLLYQMLLRDLKEKSSGSGSSGSVAAYYTVSFNTNGGSSIANQRIKSGAKAEEPQNPVKEGYVFNGWYTDKQMSIPYDFNNSITKSFTLYAKWTEKESGNNASEWKNPFVDVTENDWFCNSVKYVYESDLMNGVSDTEFAPLSDVTRAMFVTVIYRMENRPPSEPASFGDVESGSYYYAKARCMGKCKRHCFRCFGKRVFAPDENITREQIAAIMYRYARNIKDMM